MTDRSPHAVVIGAGLGGLAAAIRLGARGYRVTVVDRLDQPGGRARVFRDEGFVFDAGPTVITAPFLLEELWHLAGAELSDDVELREVTPFYRIRFHDGSVFDYTGDAEAMRAQIRELSPGDVEGYERFLAHSERIYEVGFSMLAHVPFDSPMDMARILPAMLELESLRTVWQLVSKYVKNDKLRQVLSFHTLLVGGNPFSTSSIYALIAFLERDMRVWFAMGGTGEVVRGMARLIEERLGGTLRLGAEVKQISSRRQGEGDRARRRRAHRGGPRGLERGRGLDLPPPRARGRATELVEPTRRAHALLDGPLRLVLRDRPHLRRRGPSHDPPRAALRGAPRRHLLEEGPRRGLQPLPPPPDGDRPEDGARGLRRYFYVLSPVPHLDAEDRLVRRGGARYRPAEDRALPRRQHPAGSTGIVTSASGAADVPRRLPVAQGRRLRPGAGAQQSAWFRPHNRSEDIEGLYLVGTGTHPGAGLPGVLSSARVLDTVVPDPR
ncbi:MAG: phytoene desaturase family protein [Sandaracinaceae bacterium]